MTRYLRILSIALLCMCIAAPEGATAARKRRIPKAGTAAPVTPNRIVIDKEHFMLHVITPSGDTIFTAGAGVGQSYGDKHRRGDMRTPEGQFKIKSVENSSRWNHDFNDGKGVIKNAYGPWFMRLSVPGFSSIGIHGTCFPASIGTRCSEGCIRLNNADLLKLKELVTPGMTCFIMPDPPSDLMRQALRDHEAAVQRGEAEPLPPLIPGENPAREMLRRITR